MLLLLANLANEHSVCESSCKLLELVTPITAAKGVEVVVASEDHYVQVHLGQLCVT
jgi:hypothetical protein